MCARACVCVGGACGSRALGVDRMMEAVTDVETSIRSSNLTLCTAFLASFVEQLASGIS